MISDVENEAGSCAVCPMAITRGAWQQVPPETTDHLLGAAAEILAALRTLIVAGEHLVDLQRQRLAGSRVEDGYQDQGDRASDGPGARPSGAGASGTRAAGASRLRRIDIA